MDNNECTFQNLHLTNYTEMWATKLDVSGENDYKQPREIL